MIKKLHTFSLAIALLNAGILFSQTTEDFESETAGATTFVSNSQNFTITSIESGAAVYDIEVFASGGFNGSGPDNQFIDNSSGSPITGDGSAFSISTTDGTDITVKSFYLFVSNRNISGPGTPTTITIEGKKDNVSVFTIAKSSGIVNGSAFTPNNGFTLIDFATEGGIDNSTKNVDEIIISTTGTADYLALDAFIWDAESLSTTEFEVELNQIHITPNPSSNYIQLTGLKATISYNFYDVLGKRVGSGKMTPNEKIDISKLNKGLYFIKLADTQTLKFLKK